MLHVTTSSDFMQDYCNNLAWGVTNYTIYMHYNYIASNKNLLKNFLLGLASSKNVSICNIVANNRLLDDSYVTTCILNMFYAKSKLPTS